MSGVGVNTHIQALVAAFDLDVVKLLRDAIRTTEAAAARRVDILRPAAVYEPRPHIHPEPVVEPRRHIQPPPHIEPAAVSTTANAVDARTDCGCSCDIPPAAVAESSISAPQPPWKQLPWVTLPPPAPLKTIIIRPDIIISSKGTMLDLFI